MGQKWIAPLLLLTIALCHYGYDPIASLWFAGTGYAARNLFYLLRGIEGVVLFILVGYLVRQFVVSLICLWGMVEESQTTVCRIVKGVGAPNPPHELFSGLCGSGLYPLGLSIIGLIALGFVYEYGRIKNGKE